MYTSSIYGTTVTVKDSGFKKEGLLYTIIQKSHSEGNMC